MFKAYQLVDLSRIMISHSKGKITRDDAYSLISKEVACLTDLDRMSLIVRTYTHKLLGELEEAESLFDSYNKLKKLGITI